MTTMPRVRRDYVRIGTAADALGVSVSTIKRYTEEGLLTVSRTDGGHRLYSSAQLEAIKGGEINLCPHCGAPLPDNGGDDDE